MDRYSRQRRFSPIGDRGQQKLSIAKVALVGCGALGTHIAQHLVRAGVGMLRLVDRDFVELSNLQRQVLFDEDDVANELPKAVAAERKLKRINSQVTIDARVSDVTPRTIHSLIEDVDLVIDGTDNFETRYLINDICVKLSKPWIYGGVVSSHGMVLAVRPGISPCFACVVPTPPPPGSSGSCDTIGVIGPAVAIVAALEVAEALKILTGNFDALAPGLTTIDPWRNQFSSFGMPRNPECRVCAKQDFRFLRAEAHGSATLLCGRSAVQITPAIAGQLDFSQLEKQLSPLGSVRSNEYLLRFEAEELAMTLFPDARAVIQGTEDKKRARAFYARFVGN